VDQIWVEETGADVVREAEETKAEAHEAVGGFQTRAEVETRIGEEKMKVKLILIIA